MKNEFAMRVPRCGLALLLAGAGAVAAQNPPMSQKVKIGHERPYAAEVRYERGHGTRPAVDEQWISSPGAQFVRVHFTGMDLKDGDFLTVAHPDGRQNHLYTQRGPNGNGAFWSFYVDGDTAVVSLHAGDKPGKSFRVDKVAHGDVTLEHKKSDVNLEVVCGTDGREDAPATNDVTRIPSPACSSSMAFDLPLHRLAGGGSNGSPMLTNNHCFSTQTARQHRAGQLQLPVSSCGRRRSGQTNYPAHLPEYEQRAKKG